MTFLRRLFGKGGADRQGDGQGPTPGASAESDVPDDTTLAADSDEQARDLELLRAEAARQDPLVLRQQRYAQFAWTPPPQGGTRRADDADPD